MLTEIAALADDSADRFLDFLRDSTHIGGQLMKHQNAKTNRSAEPESPGRVASALGSLAPTYGRDPTRTFTLAEQIAERVADAIIAGHFSPGTRISEQELADLFGVSRGPIRDALRILANEALVQILPRRGTVVTELSPRDVEDIFQIRASLMGLAARRVAQLRSPAIIKEFQSSLKAFEEMLSNEDADEFLRYAYRMSMMVAQRSENERLLAIIVSVARQTLHFTRIAFSERENRRIWARNWRSLAKAVLAGDENAAEIAARKLVEETGGWSKKKASEKRSTVR
jgi:DNA-binding GntR family transcriptional regulator